MTNRRATPDEPLPADTSARALTDASLVRRLAGDRESAAAELYRRYADRVRALARTRFSGQLAGRVDEDDVVQSVFRSLFNNAPRGLYQVPETEGLWALLAAVTINKVRSLYEHHRAACRDARLTVTLGEEATLGSLAAEPPDRTELIVREVLEQLPDEEREAVKLRLEGREVAEIANALGRSKRTIERLLQRARATLARLLCPPDP